MKLYERLYKICEEYYYHYAGWSNDHNKSCSTSTLTTTYEYIFSNNQVMGITFFLMVCYERTFFS
jgi:hypothetical protein